MRGYFPYTARDLAEMAYEAEQERLDGEHYIEVESFDEHYGDEINGNAVGMRLA